MAGINETEPVAHHTPSVNRIETKTPTGRKVTIIDFTGALSREVKSFRERVRLPKYVPPKRSYNP